MDRLPGKQASEALVPSQGAAIEEYDQFAGMQPVPERESQGGLQIARLISAVMRYRWLVLVIIVLGVAGSITATRFIKPEYRASATVYIEGGRAEKTGPIQPGSLVKEDSWIQLLRSFAVLDPVIRKTRLFIESAKVDSAVFVGFDLGGRKYGYGKFKLTVDPTGRRYELTHKSGSTVERGAVGDSIGRKLGWLWSPPSSALGKDREIKFTIRTPRQASEGVNTDLKTVLPQNGSFLQVALSGSDPELITAVLNGALDQFVKVAADLKQSKLTRLSADLQEQLTHADSSARSLETGLQAYRIQTITEPHEELQVSPLPPGLASTQPTVMSNYLGKKVSLASLQKERKSIEDVLRRGKEQNVVVVDAFHTIPSVKGAPDLVNALGEVSKVESELRAARLRYTDEHKIVQDLKNQLDELKNKTVPAYALRLVEQLKLQEADLQKDIDNETQELRKIPIRSLTEEKLRRESNAAVTLSQTLQDRLQENKLAIMGASPDVTILDRAVVPSDPSSNTAPRIILMGVAGSIGFALLLAILLDRIDRRFRYPEQATEELGLTILGAVPVIRKGKGVVRSPAETAQIVEAFRSIRLNLVHSFSSDAPIMAAVTSPAPGDGKSLVAGNLAMSFADAGYHTLLIDGDTRRGELFRMFHVDRTPGLLDYLDGQTGVEEIIRPTAHDRLSVVPAGSRLARGPELLGSARMVELMKRVGKLYQVVLIDTPPLGAGVDPFVLGTMTGALIIVLRAGETDRQLADAKIRLIDRLPTRVLGAVLNHINLDEGAYKYYAYEYPYREAEQVQEQLPPSESQEASVN